MKIICEKDLLVEAVSNVARAACAKSPVPALEGILLKAQDGQLQLTGYDLELGIVTTIEAKTEQPGQLILSARLLLDIIRRIPAQTVSILSDERDLATIRGGASEFTIPGLNAEEYPELPNFEQQSDLVLKQGVLKSMIDQTLFAIATTDSKPVHTGSLFDVKDSCVTLVSVDGYRLALRREAVDKIDGAESFSFVVPGSALSEVEKICSGEGPVTISQGARHILFQAGETLLVCRRLEGEFLAYRNAIPRNNPIQVECDTRTLLASIDRVSLIISEKLKSPLRCVFGDGMVSITTKTGIGDASDQCPITGDGQNLEIGFNNKYLMDALKAAPADKLKLEFSSGVAPCVILPAEGEENFVYMVLPVRLKAGN